MSVHTIDTTTKEDMRELAAFLCTPEGKAFYRKEHTYWLNHWNSQSDYEPGEDLYAWEQQDNRRMARNDALSECAHKLNLTIANTIPWGEQYNFDARLWANAKNADKLANKMLAALI